MMSIAGFLRDRKEKTPDWLIQYKSGDKPSFDEIFNAGRIVYYPGSQYDGQPIKTFNVAHYAHLFFYVDYLISKEDIVRELTKENALNGYKNIGIIEYQERDLSPRGWKPHYTPTQEDIRRMRMHSRPDDPYCLVFVFEREEGLNDEHGSDRFAVVYLKADGIATYDALFVNNNRAPNILIVQDHHMGGNYNVFGRGGALYQIAEVTGCFPNLIMVADNTEPWDHYEKIPYLQHAYTSNSGHKRWLYRRSSR